MSTSTGALSSIDRALIAVVIIAVVALGIVFAMCREPKAPLSPTEYQPPAGQQPPPQQPSG